MAGLGSMNGNVVCLGFFVSTIQGHLGKGNFDEKIPPTDGPIGKSVGTFSQLMTGMGGPSSLWAVLPLAGGPQLCKKTG